MSSVWLAMPSKRRPEEVEKVLREWRRMGYKIAIVRDEADAGAGLADLCYFSGPLWGGYPGYARSLNFLCKEILAEDSEAQWIVAAGDDTLPDPNRRPDRVAAECQQRFYYQEHLGGNSCDPTFGVMQPTGDPWRDVQGRIIERIAGSPWIGREFARRMYGGAGPYWHEYTHCFVDEELQCVAQKLGVFWQRPDVCQMHYNWARRIPGSREEPVMPPFLADANSPQHWAKFSKLFAERKKAGFPGHEPIL